MQMGEGTVSFSLLMMCGVKLPSSTLATIALSMVRRCGGVR